METPSWDVQHLIYELKQHCLCLLFLQLLLAGCTAAVPPPLLMVETLYRECAVQRVQTVQLCTECR